METLTQKTREELISDLNQSKTNGDGELPIVRDPSLLRAGDVLHLIDPLGDPDVGYFLVMNIDTRSDSHGVDRTYVSGVRSLQPDYAELLNYPPNDAAASNLPTEQYDARSIGLKPVNDEGDYTKFCTPVLVETA